MVAAAAAAAAAAPELPADAVDRRVGAQVAEEAVAVERQRRGGRRPAPRVLGRRRPPGHGVRHRHVAGRRRGASPLAHGRAAVAAGPQRLLGRRRQHGVLEQRVLAAAAGGGAALRRAAEQEQVLEPPLLAAAAAAPHHGGSGRRRGLLVVVHASSSSAAAPDPERGQRPRGPPTPRRGRRRRRRRRGGGSVARPASLQRRLRPTIRAAGSSRGPPRATGIGGARGVVGQRNARVRRVQRPDPAALEELVGGREGRRGLLQLPAEAEREVERGLVARRRGRGGAPRAARPGRARRRAGVEVAVGWEVVAGDGRGSWAARRTWRHDRHHHLHLESSIVRFWLSLFTTSYPMSSLLACSFKRPWDFVFVESSFWLGVLYW
jgi:hypothetical protein